MSAGNYFKPRSSGVVTAATRFSPNRARFRSGKTPWAVIFFLVGFTLILVLVSWGYLIPALDAAHTADRAGKSKLAATSTLVLAVILFILFVGLMMTLRLRRFFFPRPTPKRTQTPYVDAWSESAKRMETPPPDDEESGADA